LLKALHPDTLRMLEISQ